MVKKKKNRLKNEIYVASGAHYPESTAPILSISYGVFTDRSIFRYICEYYFPVHMRNLQSLRLVRKAPVGDSICGNFDLKINRSVKTPLQNI